MKRKMVIHPGDYAIGENEQLYMDMAAKGWFLYKRGAFFSWFEKGEPLKRIYRIEVASPGIWEESGQLPDEQIMLYEESGWKLAARHQLVNVFTAQEGTGQLEFYSDPRQQADTLKALKRKYTMSWIPAIVLFLLQLTMMALVSGTGMGELVSGFRVDYVENTYFWLFLGSLLVWAGADLFHGAWRIRKVYLRLKKGKYIDHAPGHRKYGYAILSGALGVCCAAMLVMTVLQQSGKTSQKLPGQISGPFLMLQDLGVEGEHKDVLSDKKSNYVEHSVSLLGEYWKVEESVQDESIYYIRQDVYEVKSPEKASALARDLMEISVFSKGAESYSQIEVQGLDAAYCTDMEYVAVKGKLVCRLVFPGALERAEELGETGSAQVWKTVSEHLAEKLDSFISRQNIQERT